MFDNIDVKKTKMSAQRKVGTAVKNEGGRPPRSNMRSSEFKLGAVIFANRQ